MWSNIIQDASYPYRAKRINEAFKKKLGTKEKKKLGTKEKKKLGTKEKKKLGTKERQTDLIIIIIINEDIEE